MNQYAHQYMMASNPYPMQSFSMSTYMPQGTHTKKGFKNVTYKNKILVVAAVVIILVAVVAVLARIVRLIMIRGIFLNTFSFVPLFFFFKKRCSPRKTNNPRKVDNFI